MRLASAAATAASGADPVAPLLRTYTFEGAEITVTRGDHGPFMEQTAAALDAARAHAANEHQRTMLQQ